MNGEGGPAGDADDCDLDGSQIEMNSCAGAWREKADAEMNRLFRIQISYLSGPNKERLQTSQSAWLTYRDKACLYEAGLREESGSMWSMQASLCEHALTLQRVEVLKSYVECRAGGCPE
jgi:uncharacterized protein YecT (DUF1311 family)